MKGETLMKKIQKLFFALVLFFSFQVSFTNVKAATVTLRYFEHEEKVFNGTKATMVKVENELSNIKDATSFTYLTRYKTTQAGFQSLFFVGNGSQPNEYVSVYLNFGTQRFGVELRNGTDNESFYFQSPKNLNDGQYHSYGFTIENGVGYALYIDGEPVKVVPDTTTRFISGSVASPKFFSIGGAERPGMSATNNWYANGTMKNTRIFIETLTPSEIQEEHFNDTLGGSPLYVQKNFATGSNDITKPVTVRNEATSYTVSTTFKHQNDTRFDLLKLSDKATLFVDPASNKAGIAYEGSEKTVSLTNGLLGKDKWYSLSYVVDKATNKLNLYVDKVLVGSVDDVKGLNELGAIDKVTLPSTFKGNVERIYFFDYALGQDGVNTLHAATDYVFEKMVDPNGTFIGNQQTLFHDGYANSNKYRIPSLLTTNKGTVLAAIDQRHQHPADWGNIDTFLRRSVDQGKTWDEGRRVIDLIDNEAAGTATSAVLIDPSMVQDQRNNRIYMLVDMFTDSRNVSTNQGGVFGLDSRGQGSGYTTVDGKKYLKLFDQSNNMYTVRENGVVFNNNNEETAYRLPQQGKKENAFKDLGNLYKDGKLVGNVYQMASELHTAPTSFLWLTYSDDDGDTWEQPIDLNPQVKAEWMRFLGTGPGVGIQLKNGRLVFPVYHTNQYNLNGSQSSAVIYSDDGVNWKMGESPNVGRTVNGSVVDPQTMVNTSAELTESQVIQLNNGDLKLFMRNNYPGARLLVATSKDFGATWENELERYDDVLEPYCQLSVIHYGDVDGKEIVVMANPENTRPNRANGVLRIGEVQSDGKINWTHKQVVTPEAFAYSSITKLPNGHIGLLYEAANLDIKYLEVDLNWIKAGLVNKPTSAPEVLGANAKVENNKLKVNVRFDKKALVGSEATLKLDMSGFELNAAYLNGSGTNTLTFEYPLVGDEFGPIHISGVEGVVEGVFKHPVAPQTHNVFDFDVIPQKFYTATANNVESTKENGQSAIDGDPNTLWHSKYNKTGPTPHELLITLDKEYDVNGFIYVPRPKDSNGIVTKYRIETSTDNVTFTPATSGDLPNNNSPKEIPFNTVKAKYVKFISEEGVGGYTSAGEVYVKQQTTPRAASKDALVALYNSLKDTPKANSTKQSFEKLTNTLKVAKEMIDATKPFTPNEVNEMMGYLNQAKAELVDRAPVTQSKEVAGKTVTAKFLAETFENENATFMVKEPVAVANGTAYDLSFEADNAKVQPLTGEKVEITLPITSGRTVLRIDHDHEGNVTPITEFTQGIDTVTFTTSQFSTFTVVYRPVQLNLTDLDAEVTKFNALDATKYEEAGYNALKAKLDEINVALQDQVNPLTQAQLDALVSEVKDLATKLVEKTTPTTPTNTDTIKPVTPTTPTTTAQPTKPAVNSGDYTNSVALVMLMLLSAVVVFGLRKRVK